MGELLLFGAWVFRGQRDEVRDPDSGFLIIVLTLPITLSLLAPYLLWVALRDVGGTRWMAAMAVVGGLLVAAGGYLTVGWWFPLVWALGTGLSSMIVIWWAGWKNHRHAELVAEESGESVPRWRLS